MQLDSEYAQYQRLLTAAEECFAAGNFPAAAGLARFAAGQAFPGHVGLFASPRLERLLVGLGQQISAAPGPDTPRNGGERRKILHVLTYARSIGGDSRFVWRWIQQETKSRHSVAITAQTDVARFFEIPEALKEATAKSGGFLRVLSAPPSTPLDQARELRKLCMQMDLVVLHLFPYDIVPVLALAAGCDSVRVAFVNHSDHTFWIGASVSDVIVHLRRQSADFLRQRRNLEPERFSILPIPLPAAPPSGPGRAEAKRALDYSPETVLLLTIATSFKYSFPGQTSFLELVTPVLEKFPQTVLAAVGPEPKGAWQEASARTNGRIRPLGVRWDNDLLYAAADVYLDSFPFSSTTSMLEAGSHGLPVLACDRANPELEVLGPYTPGLDDAIEQANSPETYQRSLDRLIRDEGFRRACGERVQKKILSVHMGGNWLQAANEVYAKLENSKGGKCLGGKDDVFSDRELDVAVASLFSHRPPANFRRQVQEYLGALPYLSRLSVLRSLRRKGFRLHPFNLLPPPVQAIVRSLGRWARSISVRPPTRR